LLSGESEDKRKKEGKKKKKETAPQQSGMTATVPRLPGLFCAIKR
jgi:hypothetical protein